MADLILICDDEADLVNTLEYSLEQAGYATRSALTGKTAIEAACRDPRPDLILLDLMLPDMPGTEVCRQIRRNPQGKDIPVIMVTARAEEIDRVVGFEIGADDYVVKPFSVRELVLRIQAVLRRAGARDRPESVGVGRVRIDREAHRAWVDRQPIELTAIEFRLLDAFLARPGRALRRSDLLAHVWGGSHHVTLRAVDTHLKRLRQKLGAAGDDIETVRGVGYRLRAGPEDED
jgi:two-component system phosphate regulon response regulator PhoB